MSFSIYTAFVTELNLLAAGAPSHGGDRFDGLRMLLALTVIVVLSLLISSPRWWKLRRHPMLSVITTGGWMSMLLGLLIGPHIIELVSIDQVDTLRPLVTFCLGWVGLMVGMQLHKQLPKMLPPHALRLSLIDASVTLLGISGVTFGTMYYLESQNIVTPVTLPIKILLALFFGTCAIGWAPETRSLSGDRKGVVADKMQHIHEENFGRLLRAVSGLCAVIAIVCYGLLFKAIPGDNSSILYDSWFQSGVIGVSMTFILGIAMGIVAQWLIQLSKGSQSQFLVFFLGFVAFTACTAAFLGFSPIFVMLISGVILINLSSKTIGEFGRLIVDAEQTIAMIVMLIAGLLADPFIGRTGLLVLAAIVLTRFFLKLILFKRILHLPIFDLQNSLLAFGPIRQSPISIAMGIGIAVAHPEQLLVLDLTSNQLLMIIILSGFVLDITLLIFRTISRAKKEEAVAT